jgi:hypothetical protein
MDRSKRRSGAIGSEALIGLGITVAALGMLGLLLGWAQQMRGISNPTVWFGAGVTLLVLGGICGVMARARGPK